MNQYFRNGHQHSEGLWRIHEKRKPGGDSKGLRYSLRNRRPTEGFRVSQPGKRQCKKDSISRIFQIDLNRLKFLLIDEADRMLGEDTHPMKKPDDPMNFLRPTFLEDLREMIGWTDLFPSVRLSLVLS
jgi:hypothetical protein